MTTSVWEAWVDAELDAVVASRRRRSLKPVDGTGPRLVDADGAVLTSFASNDYLGLSSHRAVVAAACEAIERWGTGTGSSRLIVGDRPVHHELESDLAEWKGAEAALVFPTGYQANLAVLTTVGSGARIVSDELNHASIIDGARLSRAEVKVYRHCDVDHAARLMAEAPGRAVLVSDSVFSMDGDVAPIPALSEACARSGALMVLDDAHAVFPTPEVDPGVVCLRVGTLSKTLGSQGGFVSGPVRWIELLINRARPFIFSTGLAPAAAGAARAALEVWRSAEGSTLVSRLRAHVETVRPGHASPIVPLILGSEEAALAASNRLLEAGFLVPAIRPPTVPEGTSRLRLSLSAAHLEEDVALLVRTLRSL